MYFGLLGTALKVKKRSLHAMQCHLIFSSSLQFFLQTAAETSYTYIYLIDRTVALIISDIFACLVLSDFTQTETKPKHGIP